MKHLTAAIYTLRVLVVLGLITGYVAGVAILMANISEWCALLVGIPAVAGIYMTILHDLESSERK